jgi:hypothetical protein
MSIKTSSDPIGNRTRDLNGLKGIASTNCATAYPSPLPTKHSFIFYDRPVLWKQITHKSHEYCMKYRRHWRPHNTVPHSVLHVIPLYQGRAVEAKHPKTSDEYCMKYRRHWRPHNILSKTIIWVNQERGSVKRYNILYSYVIAIRCYIFYFTTCFDSLLCHLQVFLKKLKAIYNWKLYCLG